MNLDISKAIIPYCGSGKYQYYNISSTPLFTLLQYSLFGGIVYFELIDWQ